MASVLILLEYDAAIVAAREVIYLYRLSRCHIVGLLRHSADLVKSRKRGKRWKRLSRSLRPCSTCMSVIEHPGTGPKKTNIQTLEGLRKAGLAEQ